MFTQLNVILYYTNIIQYLYKYSKLNSKLDIISFYFCIYVYEYLGIIIYIHHCDIIIIIFFLLF